MKKLLTVTCLAGLLSIPSVVFAEAAWYGSLRAGVQSTGGTEGTGSFYSRWGIKGSSEVSEGLTAVYRFETRINATNANQQEPNGRLSYVGLTGGFGSITAGQIWSATTSKFGSITDNSAVLGTSETSARHGHVVSYAVSVGSVDLQADVVMNNAGGNSETVSATDLAGKARTLSATEFKQVKDPTLYLATGKLISDGEKTTTYYQDVAAKTAYPDKTVADFTTAGTEDKLADAYEFGVTVNDIMETGRIALAHKRHDMNKYQKKSSNYLAAEYGIGGMTVYLGAAQHKSEDATGCQVIVKATEPTKVTDFKFDDKSDIKDEYIEVANLEVDTYTLATASNCAAEKRTDTTGFAGIRGSVGDTGVSYLFQARSKKTKGTGVNFNHTRATGDTVEDTVTYSLLESYDDNTPTAAEVTGKTTTPAQDKYSAHPSGTALAANKHTPWMLGLYKSLGGGATIGFEHSDPDGGSDGTKTKGTSVLWLQVDF